MTDLLIKIFIKNKEDTKDERVRKKYGVLSSFVGIILNIFLFATKFAIGIFTNSIAITADALNNLSDCGSSIISYFGFVASSKPPDEDHPFGHGRIEYLSGFVISFFVFFVGIEIVKTSIEKIIHPVDLTLNGITFFFLVLSILIKLWLSRFYLKISKVINSNSLKASSSDSLYDAFSTFATTLGIALYLVIPYNLDGILGLLVGIFILYSSIGIIKETLTPLLGKKPDEELVNKIKEILLENEICLGVHDIVIHDYGPYRVMGSAHVEVPDKINIVEAHEVMDFLERKILEELKVPFVIHTDPISTDNEETKDLRELVENIVLSVDKELSIHDFRCVFCSDHVNIIFDIDVPLSCKKADKELKKEIDGELMKKDRKLISVITFDRFFIH